MTTQRRPTHSMQETFDAEISVKTADIGLYFVHGKGDGQAMHKALSSNGAAIAARISAVKVLAVMRYPSFQGLRMSNAIERIGPVSLDEKRFELFRQAVAGTADVPADADEQANQIDSPEQPGSESPG